MQTADSPDIYADLQKKLPSNLKMFSLGGAWSSDGVTVVAKCATRGHVHRYFIRDISAGIVAGCLTCLEPARGPQLVRETAEKMLGMPLVVINEYEDYGYAVAPPVKGKRRAVHYINPIRRVVLICGAQTSREGSAEPESAPSGASPAPYLELRVEPTTAARTARARLMAALRALPANADPAHKAMAAGVIEAAARHRVHKAQLPITTYLAENNRYMQTNRIVASAMANISDDEGLYLENC